ncbi:hypothetical protein GC209_11860 [bacterium]|nr:hypothetical protein [bacterium]
MSLDRFLKTVHGWLGVLILPWIVMAGLTGFYQNHGDLVEAVLPFAAPSTDEIVALFQSQPVAQVDPAEAAKLAARLLPDLAAAVAPVGFLGRATYQARSPQGRILRIDAATGAYALQGDFVTTYHRHDGSLLVRVVNWGKLFVLLHRAGWAGDRFGTWPADLTALALVVFGSSGLYLFLTPRLRRWQWRRRVRLSGGGAES